MNTLRNPTLLDCPSQIHSAGQWTDGSRARPGGGGGGGSCSGCWFLQHGENTFIDTIDDWTFIEITFFVSTTGTRGSKNAVLGLPKAPLLPLLGWADPILVGGMRFTRDMSACTYARLWAGLTLKASVSVIFTCASVTLKGRECQDSNPCAEGSVDRPLGTSGYIQRLFFSCSDFSKNSNRPRLFSTPISPLHAERTSPNR